MYKELLEKYTVTSEDYKKMKSLTTEESNKLQVVIEELYNTNGELAIKKHLQDTREMDELLADYVNIGGLSTAIYDDPYRLNIFVPYYPPHLKEHNKNKFSPNLGYDTKMRWQHYMGCAVHNLRAKGAVKFAEKVIVIIKYHFPKERYDVDNYAIKFINDAFKNSNLIADDDHSHLSILSCGVLDMENKGMEITIISQQNFNINPAAFI
jgi:hypothetical protein